MVLKHGRAAFNVSHNTPKDADQARYLQTRAAFVGQGTTLNAWCKANGTHIQNVRDAFLGRWTGEKATQLRDRVTEAAGVKYLFKTAGGAARLPDRPAALATDLETTICEQLGLKPGSLRD